MPGDVVSRGSDRTVGHGSNSSRAVWQTTKDVDDIVADAEYATVLMFPLATLAVGQLGFPQ